MENKPDAPIGPKPRVFKSDTEYVYIPADSRERPLTSPDPSVHHLSNQDIQRAGISSLTAGYLVERHRYPAHLILYTRSGSGFLKIGKQERELKAGDVFIAPWQSEYSYGTNHSWQILWTHLQPGKKWDNLISAPPQTRTASWMVELERVMEGYIGEVNRRHPDSSVFLHSYSNLIAHYIRRELGKENPTAVKLESVWDHIQQHITRKWSVNDMAQQAGMSRTQFYQTVFKQTGSTPMQMLHTMRMEQACSLLLYTDHSIDTIAEAVGYEDRYAFSKAFKRYAKVGPARFREQ